MSRWLRRRLAWLFAVSAASAIVQALLLFVLDAPELAIVLAAATTAGTAGWLIGVLDSRYDAFTLDEEA